MFRCLVAEQELASGNTFYLINFQKCHGIYFLDFFNSRCHAKLFSVNFFSQDNYDLVDKQTNLFTQGQVYEINCSYLALKKDKTHTDTHTHTAFYSSKQKTMPVLIGMLKHSSLVKYSA